MSYKKLNVWQRSMDLATSVYHYTKSFPSHEQFGLTSQMRRAAVSIPSNIAEGSRRRGKDAHQFLLISFGSGSELETQLELSQRLNYGDGTLHAQCDSLLSEVMRMLNTMTQRKS
jgi:four helix bundle protein